MLQANPHAYPFCGRMPRSVCAVHAERRSDPEQTGRYNAKQPQLLILHSCKQSVDPVLRKNRDQRTDRHSDDPVPEDLPKLQIKVIPDINEFSLQDRKDVTHQCLPSHRFCFQVRSLRRVPEYEFRSCFLSVVPVICFPLPDI